MSEPVVSVVICVRNGERYLAQAHDSVVAQSLDHIEVIVVDDGSSDNSTGLAERHAAQPKIVRRPPLGLPAALNEGLLQATGRFIAFLDCDDIWPAERLHKMLAPFGMEPACDFVFGAMVNTDSALRPIGNAALARMLTAGLLRRAAALAVGDFRTDVVHGSAIDWISRAASIGLKFVVINDLVLLRRVHGDNMGIVQRERARRDLLRVIRDHRVRRDK